MPPETCRRACGSVCCACGTALGLVTALKALPVLLSGAWSGNIADRVTKRIILYATQGVSSGASLTMGALVIIGIAKLWMVFALAVLPGCVKVFDNPARQAFVHEMLGRDRLTNAVSLNSMELNHSRATGPSIAGILAATVGLGACFIDDGVFYLAAIASTGVGHVAVRQDTESAKRLGTT